MIDIIEVEGLSKTYSTGKGRPPLRAALPLLGHPDPKVMRLVVMAPKDLADPWGLQSE